MALSTPSTTLPPSYVYKSLPTSPATIRLIKIHNETSSFDDPINCEIHHVSLDAASGYRYTGLSYVWGEPNYDQTIHCDECVIKVTSHLHGAIQSLRSRRVTWVWIDAICIDQSNIAERNAQVSIMGRIFKQTHMTYAYLGKIDADGEQVAGVTIRLSFLHFLLRRRSRRDLELLRDNDSDDVVLKEALQNHPCASERERTWFGQWRNYCMSIFELREYISEEKTDRILQVLGLPVSKGRLWRSYADLFGYSSWFQRGWVIQEAVLSPRVRLLLGSEIVDLEDIGQSLAFIADSGLGSAGLESLGPFISMAGEMMDLRNSGRPRDLLQLLRTFRRCETSDPRDKIYSLLGLAEDLDEAAPKPDYHQSEEHVFSSYARYLIQQQRQANLDILTDAGTVHGSTRGVGTWEAGTWVPRWDKRLQLWREMAGTENFCASGSMKSAFSYGINFSYGSKSPILVRGVIYDKVGRLGAMMTNHSSWYTWEKAVSNLGQHGTNISVERYAKALVADFFGQGIEYFSDSSTHSWTFTDLYEHVRAGQDLAAEHRDFMNWSARLTDTHGFVLTYKKNIGWVPWDAKCRDIICIVFGVKMPLVIREVENGKYILIGAAYIEGIMYGEVFEETNIEGEDIMLV